MKTIVLIFLPRSIIAAVLVLFGGEAKAEFVSGEVLFHLFSGDKQAQDQALGYSVGVHDALMGTTHCSNAALTGTALRDMTRKMLEDAGPMRALTADTLIASMLKEAFPCPKEDKPAGASGLAPRGLRL